MWSRERKEVMWDLGQTTQVTNIRGEEENKTNRGWEGAGRKRKKINNKREKEKRVDNNNRTQPTAIDKCYKRKENFFSKPPVMKLVQQILAEGNRGFCSLPLMRKGNIKSLRTCYVKLLIKRTGCAVEKFGNLTRSYRKVNNTINKIQTIWRKVSHWI